MLSVLHRRRVERGFEQQRDVRLADDLVVEQQVPHLPAALRVVDGVVEPELLEQAALAPSRAAAMRVGAHDVHLHFARRVAAQPRPVLHQDHLRAVARRRHRRADARHPAAGHQHVGIQVDLRHVALVRQPCGAVSLAALSGRTPAAFHRLKQTVPGGRHAACQYRQGVAAGEGSEKIAPFHGIRLPESRANTQARRFSRYLRMARPRSAPRARAESTVTVSPPALA